MASNRKKATAYTLSLIPAGGRARPVTLFKGKPGLFIVVLLVVMFLLAGLSGLLLFGTPLRDMVPVWALPGNQGHLLARQAARVDSLVVEIEKMRTLSQKMEGAMIQENVLADRTIPAGGGVGRNVFESGIMPVSGPAVFREPPAFTGRLVSGSVSQRFKPGRSHYGIDIATSRNQPVGAVADGSVIFADWTGAFGYTVIVDHGEYTSFYKHCSRLFKKGGEQVKLGEVIALAGDTGHESSGVHLHFEVWKNGIPVDPEAYLNISK